MYFVYKKTITFLILPIHLMQHYQTKLFSNYKRLRYNVHDVSIRDKSSYMS